MALRSQAVRRGLVGIEAAMFGIAFVMQFLMGGLFLAVLTYVLISR